MSTYTRLRSKKLPDTILGSGLVGAKGSSQRCLCNCELPKSSKIIERTFSRQRYNHWVPSTNLFHSIETPVSKSFRPRCFFVRNPRHPAETRHVTPVFSVTYDHAATGAVSLLPTPPMEKADAGAASGAQISGKSRPNQRHAGSGLDGAFPSRERFPEF